MAEFFLHAFLYVDEKRGHCYWTSLIAVPGLGGEGLIQDSFG